MHNTLKHSQYFHKVLKQTLDEDVAQVFATPGAVHKALRALIKVVPQTALEVDELQDVDRNVEQSKYPQKSYSIAEVRKQYPRACEPWHVDEDEQLRWQYNQQVAIDVIAKQSQRQPGAIRSRLKKLGLL